MSIQYPFDNTFNDIWEYGNKFSSINFEAYLGEQCPICGKINCYTQIAEYYRNAISLFPYKKGIIPVARFLCNSTGRTFSLLPYQLIPYHQYTVDSIIGTLLTVHHYQCLGQKGYHRACLELNPDCLVTPYLIQTWAMLVSSGFIRGHPFLKASYPLSVVAKATCSTMIQTIYLYLEGVAESATLHRRCILPVLRCFCDRVGNFLFGTSSRDRIRAP